VFLAISPGDNRDLLPWLTSLSRGGLHTILLREPQISAQRLHHSLLHAQSLGMQAIVHERCPGARELAQQMGLVLHLRAGSPVPAQPFAISAHHPREVDTALQRGAVYVLLSPVWRPTSKPGDAREPLGLEAFLEVARAHPPGRVLALGGVTPERWALLREQGAGAAVLGPLSLPAGPELAATARAFRAR
jgi:thiamine monophosphate synthase